MYAKLRKKDIKGKFVFGVPYCKLQKMLSMYQPVGYYANAYGWRCDVYLIDDIIITTGYEPIGRVPKVTWEKYNNPGVESFKAFVSAACCGEDE